MSEPAPTAISVEAMLELTERLTDLLAGQARAFEEHRPHDVAAGLAEITQLTNAYRAGSAYLKAQPALFQAAPAALRRRLIRATEAFEAVLQRQGRALAASKTITEGLVKAIADEIASRRNVGRAYGPNATRPIAATAITLNRQA
jgi:hypothetical protein